MVELERLGRAVGVLDPALHRLAGGHNAVDLRGHPVTTSASSHRNHRKIAARVDLRHQLAAWYRHKGWTQALELGDQMFGILMNVRPTSPEQEIKVFLACATVLFKGSMSFKENGWTNLSRGKVVLRSVGIEIVPLMPCAP